MLPPKARGSRPFRRVRKSSKPRASTMLRRQRHRHRDARRSCDPRPEFPQISSLVQFRERKARLPTSASGQRPARAALGRQSDPSCPGSRSSRSGSRRTRTAVESSGPVSIFQRCWSGSRPLKRLTSSFTRSRTTPAVSTPKLMCVESSQWWLIGASGESKIASRCMKAGGPNAGSPGRPA